MRGPRLRGLLLSPKDRDIVISHEMPFTKVSFILAAAFAAIACTEPPPSGPHEEPEDKEPVATLATSHEAPPPQLDGRSFPDKVLAMTWDDGPDENTLELARFLSREKVSATFFVVSEWTPNVAQSGSDARDVSSDPGWGHNVFETGHAKIPILRDLVALGHRIGNHTLNHVLLDTADVATVRRQLLGNQATIDPYITDDLRLFRVPGGAWSLSAARTVETDAVLSQLIGPVRWDIDGKDWEASVDCASARPNHDCEANGPNGGPRVKASITAHRYLSGVEAAGHGIVLLHDRVGHVGSRYALEVAHILIPELKDRGYVFAAPILAFSPLATRSLPTQPPSNPPPSGSGRRVHLPGVDESTLAFGDLNGDGRSDVCGKSGDTVVCALSAGRTFTGASAWLAAGATRLHGLRLVDVNGDGRADVCGDDGDRFVCGLAP
jgi:peptidoglycan/xylan/chitin deacetylase (PgdA/CDA1 family)